MGDADDENRKRIKISSYHDITRFTAESNHLRSIFPEEVWIKILEMVKLLIPMDLENWSNSSPYFRHLLKDHRVTFLFPKVFQILAPKYEHHYPPDQVNCFREDGVLTIDPEWEYHRIRQADPDPLNTGEYLKYPHTLTGIKKCRLTCSSWNKAIEDYYQNPIKAVAEYFTNLKYDKMINERFRLYSDEIDRWKRCHFSYFIGNPNEDPGQFIQHFEETHYLQKNPFSTRSISIQFYNFMDDNHLQVLFNRLEQLLTKYGQHVWYCYVDMDINTRGFRTHAWARGFVQQYTELRRWLNLMPNLKILKIRQGIDRDTDNWKCLDPLNEYLSPLIREIERNPLPTLEHLEILAVTDLLAPTFNQLIHQNNHISGVQMERKYAHEKVYKYDFDFVLSSIPNLKQLAIHSFTEDELIKLEEKSGELHLEKFQLTDPKGSPFHWGRLLGLVKGSSGTLTDLVLELPFIGNKEGEDLLEMTKGSCSLVGHLEKLERVFLFVGRPLFLDWLLPVISTLRELKLVIPPYIQRVKGYDKVVKEQTIELFGFEERMDKSNIWKAFRKLKIVKIGKGYLSDCAVWKEFIRP